MSKKADLILNMEEELHIMIERKYYLNESDFDYDRMERLIEIEEVAQKIYEVFRDRLSYEDTLRSLFIEVSQSPYLSAVYQYHTN